MPRQCRNPRCIGSKKRLTNKEKEPKPTTTLNHNSLENSNASQNRNTQKHSRILFNESKNYKSKKCQVSQSTSESSTSTYFPPKLYISNAESARSNKFEQVPGGSYTERICTCGGRSNSQRRNSHRCANTWSIPVESSRRRRMRRRRKKASKRESDRPRGCFTTFCICMRGRTLDELRACKCASSHEVLSSHHECCCVKNGRKGACRLMSRSALQNDIQVGGYTADPSTSEPLSAKPNEERGMIIRGLNAIRRRIDGLTASTIKLFGVKR